MRFQAAPSTPIHIASRAVHWGLAGKCSTSSSVVPRRRLRPAGCTAGMMRDLLDLDTEAASETTRSPVTTIPRVVDDPGGLPRDRNTPRIETRRIPDLETLGNHEP